MADIKVKDLTNTASVTTDNQLMVLTNDVNNTVQNITIDNLLTSVISEDSGNGITKGTDNKLYVDNTDSGVTAGTYQYPQNLVVDSKGKITGLVNGSPASVPIATSTTVGIVKPDNSTISVANDGTISATIRNIGEVVTSAIPLTDAGLHLLDGALISSGSYSAFVDYIGDLYDSGDYTGLFETEANWQTSVTNYSVCGKFVYDSVNNTVRLPKITGFIEGTTDLTALGDLVQAGLPNITGQIGVETSPNNTTGAFYRGSFSQAGWQGSSSTVGTNFDASLSNSIYGNSTTVQPQAIKVLYYIVIATSAKTDIQVDIDDIATDLNGKADTDLSNISASASAKGAITTWGMPDYTAGVTKTNNIDYSETTNGYLIVDYTSDTNSAFDITINGTSFKFDQGYSGSDYNHCNVGVIPIPKNIQYRITYLEGCRVRYFPCIGG